MHEVSEEWTVRTMGQLALFGILSCGYCVVTTIMVRNFL